MASTVHSRVWPSLSRLASLAERFLACGSPPVPNRCSPLVACRCPGQQTSNRINTITQQQAETDAEPHNALKPHAACKTMRTDEGGNTEQATGGRNGTGEEQAYHCGSLSCVLPLLRGAIGQQHNARALPVRAEHVTQHAACEKRTITRDKRSALELNAAGNVSQTSDRRLMQARM